MPHRRGTAGQVVGRGGEIPLAQRDQAEQAMAEGGIAGCLPGCDHRRLGGGGRRAHLPAGQAEAGIQDRQRRFGWDAPHGRPVDALDHLLGFVVPAQVSQAGRDGQPGLGMAGIGGYRAAPAARLLEQLDCVADLPVVPADQGDGHQRHGDRRAAVPGWFGQDAGGQAFGVRIRGRPGQRLEVCRQGRIAHVRGQVRLGERRLGLSPGQFRLAARAQDRGQGAAQPGLVHRRQWLRQPVLDEAGRAIEPPGRGECLGGGHQPGPCDRGAGRARGVGTGQVQGPQRQPGGGLRIRGQQLGGRVIQARQRRAVSGGGGFEQMAEAAAGDSPRRNSSSPN